MLFAGIYLVFVTIMCFLSVAMTIIVIHLYTHSVAVHPIQMPYLVSSLTSRFIITGARQVAAVCSTPNRCAISLIATTADVLDILNINIEYLTKSTY